MCTLAPWNRVDRPIGRLSVGCRLTVSRRSSFLPTVSRPSVDCRWKNRDRLSNDCQWTVGRLSAKVRVIQNVYSTVNRDPGRGALYFDKQTGSARLACELLGIHNEGMMVRSGLTGLARFLPSWRWWDLVWLNGRVHSSDFFTRYSESARPRPSGLIGRSSSCCRVIRPGVVIAEFLTPMLSCLA